MNLDNDRLIAAVDLVGRTGATGFEFGYLHEDKPVEEAGWYATAFYHGAKVFVEDHPGPVEAVEALAHRLLIGGMCVRCARVIVVGRRSWRRRGGTECVWHRVGNRWEMGCA